MHIEFDWEGPGSYFLIPAVVRSGEVDWKRDPLHVANTGDIQCLLDEVKFWEETTHLDDDPIWREGGVIYRGDIKDSDRFYAGMGQRL